MTRKRRSLSVTSSSPFWMTTYSDLVTQILIFFVLLYSMSVMDVQRFASAMASIQETLGMPPVILQPTETPPVRPPADDEGMPLDPELLIRQKDLAQILTVLGKLEEALGDEGQVELLREERGIVVRFSDEILFDTGRADLRGEALQALDRLFPVLAAVPNDVRVEGHTDSRPIRTLQFPSNWELSTSRATAVVRYLLEERGLDATRLSAAGYGEYRPVADNDTLEGMARNRRVDVVILRLSLSAAEPQGQGRGEGD
ncbi:MAG TPA: OmpA family protein [Bacillota bacterium]|nr:OmpA family protein [Bacillota bacterium]